VRPGVGLLFLVPGFEDALRINGTARITTEPALMERFMADGKPPRSVMVIAVTEAYLHCPKAIKRAQLWNPATHNDRKTFPTAGQIYRDQMKLDMPAQTIDAALDFDSKNNLY
jgi:predicted pyridoxine 5'-phosphate oxidase superfamily flavin-nucleotide-binding protein